MDASDLVPLSVAAAYFPKRSGRKIHVRSVRRRIHTGVRGVRLEARRDGGEWFTCREWVEKFLADVTAASLKPPRMTYPPCGVVKTSERVKRLLAKRWGIQNAK